MTVRRRHRAKPQEPIKLADVIKPPQENPPAPVSEGGADATSASPKRRRRSSVGGHALKLSAPTRPGYKRRFFNDVGNRIAEAEELGYTPVSDTKAKSPGLGSSDTRLVGTKATGEPLRSILMETPDELYAEGVAEKEAANRQIDEAITAGRDSTGRPELQDNSYGHGSIKVER
jgi:hypothetical protein